MALVKAVEAAAAAAAEATDATGWATIGLALATFALAIGTIGIVWQARNDSRARVRAQQGVRAKSALVEQVDNCRALFRMQSVPWETESLPVFESSQLTRYIEEVPLPAELLDLLVWAHWRAASMVRQMSARKESGGQDARRSSELLRMAQLRTYEITKLLCCLIRAESKRTEVLSLAETDSTSVYEQLPGASNRGDTVSDGLYPFDQAPPWPRGPYYADCIPSGYPIEGHADLRGALRRGAS